MFDWKKSWCSIYQIVQSTHEFDIDNQKFVWDSQKFDQIKQKACSTVYSRIMHLFYDCRKYTTRIKCCDVYCNQNYNEKKNYKAHIF